MLFSYSMRIFTTLYFVAFLVRQKNLDLLIKFYMYLRLVFCLIALSPTCYIYAQDNDLNKYSNFLISAEVLKRASGVYVDPTKSPQLNTTVLMTSR